MCGLQQFNNVWPTKFVTQLQNSGDFFRRPSRRVVVLDLLFLNSYHLLLSGLHQLYLFDFGYCIPFIKYVTQTNDKCNV